MFPVQQPSRPDYSGLAIKKVARKTAHAQAATWKKPTEKASASAPAPDASRTNTNPNPNLGERSNPAPSSHPPQPAKPSDPKASHHGVGTPPNHMMFAFGGNTPQWRWQTPGATSVQARPHQTLRNQPHGPLSNGATPAPSDDSQRSAKRQRTDSGAQSASNHGHKDPRIATPATSTSISQPRSSFPEQRPGTATTQDTARLHRQAQSPQGLGLQLGSPKSDPRRSTQVPHLPVTQTTPQPGLGQLNKSPSVGRAESNASSPRISPQEAARRRGIEVIDLTTEPTSRGKQSQIFPGNTPSSTSRAQRSVYSLTLPGNLSAQRSRNHPAPVNGNGAARPEFSLSPRLMVHNQPSHQTPMSPGAPPRNSPQHSSQAHPRQSMTSPFSPLNILEGRLGPNGSRITTLTSRRQQSQWSEERLSRLAESFWVPPKAVQRFASEPHNGSSQKQSEPGSQVKRPDLNGHTSEAAKKGVSTHSNQSKQHETSQRPAERTPAQGSRYAGAPLPLATNSRHPSLVAPSAPPPTGRENGSASQSPRIARSPQVQKPSLRPPSPCSNWEEAMRRMSSRSGSREQRPGVPMPSSNGLSGGSRLPSHVSSQATPRASAAPPVKAPEALASSQMQNAKAGAPVSALPESDWISPDDFGHDDFDQPETQKAKFDSSTFDALIYSQPEACEPPPGVKIDPLVNKIKTEPRKFIYLNPAVQAMRPRNEKWHKLKAEEIKARGGRKVWFGKAAKRERWRCAMDEAQNGSIPQPWSHNVPTDFGQVAEKDLPPYVQENPAWLRACAWLRETARKAPADQPPQVKVKRPRGRPKKERPKEGAQEPRTARELAAEEAQQAYKEIMEGLPKH